MDLRFFFIAYWREYLILYGCCLLMYWCGYFRGRYHGRKEEKRKWENEIEPEVRRLRKERDQLWRSAVSKTQRLRRIERGIE